MKGKIMEDKIWYVFGLIVFLTVTIFGFRFYNKLWKYLDTPPCVIMKADRIILQGSNIDLSAAKFDSPNPVRWESGTLIDVIKPEESKK